MSEDCAFYFIGVQFFQKLQGLPMGGLALDDFEQRVVFEGGLHLAEGTSIFGRMSHDMMGEAVELNESSVGGCLADVDGFLFFRA